MNAAASVNTRHGNLPAKIPMRRRIIEISDDEDEVNGVHDAIINLDSSDNEQRKRSNAGIKAEQVQPNAFDNNRLHNAVPHPANIPAPPSIMKAARSFSDAPALQGDWGGDYIHDDIFDDAELTRIMMEEISAQSRTRAPPQDMIAIPGTAPTQVNQIEEDPVESSMEENGVETRTNVVVILLSVFPDICQDHVSELYDTVSSCSGQLIAHILDQTENGKPYPKSKDKQKSLKRKRDVDKDATANLRYGAADRAPPPVFGLTRTTT